MLKNAQLPPLRGTRIRARIPGIEKHILLNELEVAEITGTPRGTLSRWRCAGKGPTWVKLEGSVRYHLSDVLSYVEECKQSSVRASMEEMHATQKAR